MKGLLKKLPIPGAEYCEDLPIPTIKEDEVLVKVHATAICGTDMHIYGWTQYAMERVKLPMVFGHEFSGEIMEAGARVSNFKPGDRVAGETHIPCNHCEQCRTGNQHICENLKIIGVNAVGAFAEYIPVSQDCLWKLTNGMEYETAALLEPMGVAVHGILSGEIGGKSVAVLGCGPIGTCAVGAAKASGASIVFAMDLAEDKLALATSMGADITLNSKEEDAVARVLALTGGVGVDVVVDYTGNGAAISTGFRMLKKGGRFTFVGLANSPVSLDINDDIVYKEAKINGVTGRLMYKTWYQCQALIDSGKFDLRKIIGGIYPMRDFEKAFQAIKDGKPGKMLLIP